MQLPIPTSNPDQLGGLTVDWDQPSRAVRNLRRDGLAGGDVQSLAIALAACELTEGTFFDVGANVGVFSWLVAGALGRRAVAFEPAPALRAVTEQVVRDNDLPIVSEGIALSDETGRAQLHLSDVSDASNSLREGFRPSSTSIEVPVEPLDEYCDRTGEAPGLMKIDVETFEAHVLRGARQTIQRARPWIICEVLPGRTGLAAEICAEMERHGYAFFQIVGDFPLVRLLELTPMSSTAWNWLFSPVPDPPDSLWGSAARWQVRLGRCGPPADARGASATSRPSVAASTSRRVRRRAGAALRRLRIR